jgi:hypothetical protein
MPEEERTEEETPDMQADDAEMMGRLQEEIRNLPVHDHLVYMMHSLSALAVGRMGFEADSAARRDLDQARLAIDAFKALVEVLDRVRPAGEMAGHRGVLSQLQLAYVGALDADTAGATEGSEGTAAAGTAAAAEAEAEPPQEDGDTPEQADRP